MGRRLLLPLLAAACAASTVSGCGGSHGPSHTSTTAGRAVFARACGSCHTISGHEDPRRQGGDLLGFHASRRQMRQLAGEMPVRHPLSQSELEAVVSFVLSMEAGGRR